MKKILILLTIACVSAPLFALPDFNLSAGGGGIFNMHWKTAELKDKYTNYSSPAGYGVLAPDESTQDAMRQGLFDTEDLTAGGGIQGFFDATYAEAGVGIVWNHVSQTVAIPNKPDISSSMGGSITKEYLFTQLNLSLLLKYPFSISPKFKLFPLVGIDGQIALGDYDPKLKEDFQIVANLGYDMPTLGEFWNSLWIKAGVGADYLLTDKLFIRCEALYGFKLNSDYDNRMAEYWKEDLRGVANGFNIRLGVGYTFKDF